MPPLSLDSHSQVRFAAGLPAARKNSPAAIRFGMDPAGPAVAGVQLYGLAALLIGGSVAAFCNKNEEKVLNAMETFYVKGLKKTWATCSFQHRRNIARDKRRAKELEVEKRKVQAERKKAEEDKKAKEEAVYTGSDPLRQFTEKIGKDGRIFTGPIKTPNNGYSFYIDD